MAVSVTVEFCVNLNSESKPSIASLFFHFEIFFSSLRLPGEDTIGPILMCLQWTVYNALHHIHWTSNYADIRVQVYVHYIWYMNSDAACQLGCLRVSLTHPFRSISPYLVLSLVLQLPGVKHACKRVFARVTLIDGGTDYITISHANLPIIHSLHLPYNVHCTILQNIYISISTYS